jgi:hypothetical protein
MALSRWAGDVVLRGLVAHPTDIRGGRSARRVGIGPGSFTSRTGLSLTVKPYVPGRRAGGHGTSGDASQCRWCTASRSGRRSLDVRRLRRAQEPPRTDRWPANPSGCRYPAETANDIGAVERRVVCCSLSPGGAGPAAHPHVGTDGWLILRPGAATLIRETCPSIPPRPSSGLRCG